MNFRNLTAAATATFLSFGTAASADTICTYLGCVDQDYGTFAQIEARTQCQSPAYLTVRDGVKTCVRRDNVPPVTLVNLYCSNGSFLGLVGDKKKCVNYRVRPRDTS